MLVLVMGYGVICGCGGSCVICLFCCGVSFMWILLFE